MKFAYKLTFSITLLLVVFLSLGGTFLVRSAFRDALDGAVRQSTGQHLLEKYAFEADLLDISTRSEKPTDEHLRRYADSITGYFGSDGGRLFALYSDAMEPLFSNLPKALGADARRDALATESDECILRSAGDETYLLMASRIDTPDRALWLLSAFDITSLYLQRSAQLRTLWQMEAGLLVLAVVIISLLSAVLTRPIKQLSRASRSIAGGAYGRRTGVRTTDEIGDLARDFDTMAGAVEEKMAELNDSIRQRDDFVSAFTHEIKTPMTSLIGYANLLRSAEYEPKIRQMAANHIYREAKRLESLSRKLLELMGLAEGSIEMAPVRADTLFNDAVRSLYPLPEGMVMLCEGQKDATVLADRELAADLLRNLMLNALRAAPADGAVHVRFRPGRTRCTVLVRDAGCGIPADELARITEPFYMVDKSRARKMGGSGIGLSLCSRVAALHGGALRFRSRVGAGTVVRFTLPLPQSAARALPATQLKPPPPLAPPPQKRRPHRAAGGAEGRGTPQKRGVYRREG